MSVIVTFAPTGPVATKRDNPSLPTQPEEIAEQVEAAYHAGASVAHLHLRDENDKPTADPEIVRRTMDLIAERCPILVQLTTGVGPNVTFEAREALLELRPAMATLNPCSMTFGEAQFLNPPDLVRRMALRMQELGVKPELEIYDTGHLDFCVRLLEQGVLTEPLHVGLVLGVSGGMTATPDNLLLMARRLPPHTVWQVIAEGKANRTLTAIGLALGGNCRAGLEDALREDALDEASDTSSEGYRITNLELVTRATTLARDLGLEVATVDEARQRLELAVV
jgi:3-keto-5-aminohexanoate cleavage enzyme